ncbi:hypothetical protein DL95DRAFT_246390, partial [Leptodontidium sp. 2 PMI_412]
LFICECYPKTPKRFDTHEETNAHEKETLYRCSDCNTRFKNKNEAQCHQNSLHINRHSWSCAALSGYTEAFQPSADSSSDTCGFCEEQFRCNNQMKFSLNTFVASEADWDERIIQPKNEYKFGECNHEKKFFRAEHFQHLKQSHAGSTGIWAIILTDTCRRDEPLPKP